MREREKRAQSAAKLLDLANIFLIKTVDEDDKSAIREIPFRLSACLTVQTTEKKKFPKDLSDEIRELNIVQLGKVQSDGDEGGRFK
jgi:sporulation-control protein spo0M